MSELTSKLTAIRDNLNIVKSSNNVAFENKNTATVDVLTAQTESIENIWFKTPEAGITFNSSINGNMPPDDEEKLTFNVKNIQITSSCVNMFKGLNEFSTIDLSESDFSNATKTNSMFAENNSLINVISGNLDMSKVTEAQLMFYGCSSLKYVENIENWNTSNLQKTNQMFQSVMFDKLDLSNWDVSNLTSADNMFQNSNIGEISLNWENVNDTISIIQMFSGCGSLKKLDMSGFNYNGSSLNLNGAFSYCRNLEELMLPEKRINISVLTNTFINCNSLVSLDLSNFDTSNVSYYISTFSGCTSLETLDLSGWVMPSNISTTYTNNMFNNCSSLKTVICKNMSSTDLTKLKTIMGRNITIDNITFVTE